MSTECNGKLFEFHPLGHRDIRADFSGGAVTSDGGGLLLREVEKRTGILARFAGCFQDHREAETHHVGLGQIGTLQHSGSHFFSPGFFAGSCIITITYRTGLENVLGL